MMYISILFAALLHSSSFLFRLRQNLREKHSRHVADLKAYYESEIQILRDKLKLRDLPQDLEKTNQALTKRCVFIYLIYQERLFTLKVLSRPVGLHVSSV